MENKTCNWCYCEATEAHSDGKGNHIDLLACKTALMIRVMRLESELSRAHEEIERLKDEFIR